MLKIQLPKVRDNGRKKQREWSIVSRVGEDVNTPTRVYTKRAAGFFMQRTGPRLLKQLHMYLYHTYHRVLARSFKKKLKK